jgi:VWFA-related protein
MKYSIKRLKPSIKVLLTILLTGTSVSILAQNKDESIRVDTNLVLINVLVRDKNGQLVRGLKPEQFEVFDDEKKQPIESYSTGEASVSFGIVYDMHPTTDERTKSVIESLWRFKAELGPGDDMFLAAFNMRGEQTFDFVPTFDQFEKHMTAPGKREPYSLYDAVYFASDRIQASRNQKRALLIISDSADHHSRHSLSQVREKVNDIRAEVYAVIFDENEGYGYSDITQKSKERYPFSRDASPLDRAAIVDLTLRSGGSTFVGGSQNALRLFTIYTQIANDIRSYYTLGFYPGAVDDKQHSVRVKLRGVPGAKDFVLTYRPSYRNLRRPVSQR